MTSTFATWQPAWTVAPGEILADELELRGLSQSELARRMGRPIKTINEIVNGKTAVTADTALQLEAVLDIPARLWLSLESSYREHLARSRAFTELEGQEAWAKRFPLADLRRRNLIAPSLRGGELVAAMLNYFGVGTVQAWERLWGDPIAAFRHSPSFESDPVALAAWLRWGERYADTIETATFDAEELRRVLDDARGMTREEPLSDVLEELQERLAGCGVVLALTPTLKGIAVSGAARWLSDGRALIQLSMRYRTDDHLWFTFFHEAIHLFDPKREGRLDGDDQTEDSVERRVDAQARDLLLPPAAFGSFVMAGIFTVAAVRAFAKDVGVAPGIVVGRLEYDGHVSPGQLARLKRPVSWQ